MPRQCLVLLAVCLAAVPAHGVRLTDRSSSTPVERHGKLSVEGGKIVDETGKNVRLRGVSLSSSQFAPGFYTSRTVEWLVQDWQITVLRAAMGIEADGYLTNREAEKGRVESVVKAAIAAGIYVIVEWHDKHADAHLDEAKTFFAEMAQAYGQYPNVLFEPFSEPGARAWSTVIKPNHEAIVAAIRPHTNNIIILGSPRKVDDVAGDPVSGTNLAYSVHFNAARKSKLRDDLMVAINRGVCVFASGWVAVDEANRSNADAGELRTWLDFLQAHDISDVNWAVGNNSVAGLALWPGTQAVSHWLPNDLTKVGGLVRASLRGEAAPPPPCAECSAQGENCMATGCCRDPGMTCYKKGDYFASCMSSCVPGVHEDDDPKFKKSWACVALGGACTASCSLAGENCHASGCCRAAGLQCFAKDEFFAGCRETCTPGVDPKEATEFQTAWSCSAAGPTRPATEP